MSDAAPLLMLGLPKGSLEESTKSLFAKAGWRITTSSRSYRPSIDDPELDGRFVRAQEVSRYVEHGFFDCGLTGHDWVRENGSDVVEVCDLVYSRASTQKSRWVLCVPESSPVRSAADLAGKRICKVALQKELSLPAREVPLLAAISRFTPQKGLDLIASVLPELMRLDVQVALLGTGDPPLELQFLDDDDENLYGPEYSPSTPGSPMNFRGIC